MTNGEKYRTAQERAEAFALYCDGRMAVTDKQCSLDQECYSCQFAWLDLEADDENPLPCPFCGGECAINGSGRVYQVACKAFCGYVSMKKETESDSIADHNRVAKKCMEVKE